MQLAPTIPAAAVRPPVGIATQATLSPAAFAAQATVAQTQTQTPFAPSATGRAEGGREPQSRTQTGRSTDPQANAIHARADRGGQSQSRGGLVNVFV